jgi:RNA polymerase sigma-70 factor (ECF subfamily)
MQSVPRAEPVGRQEVSVTEPVAHAIHAFEPLRPWLVSVAYRMMGTLAEAEDVVQSAWVRVSERAPEPVRHPRAWWTRVVTRMCLDELDRAHRRHETYVGPWLPEPLAEAAFAPLLASATTERESEGLYLATLAVLQRLSPLERAAFLLREVCDDDYAEIAQALGREAAAVRQLVHRARAQLRAERPRFSVDADEHLRLLQAFAWATVSGDVDGLRLLLHADCIAFSDAGGKAQSATRPVLGPERVARFYVGLGRNRAEAAVPQVVEINGLPALALFDDTGRCHTLIQLVIVDGQVHRFLGTRNPDKLGTVRASA